MPLTSQTLYAVWNNAVVFSDAIGKTDSSINDVEAGTVVDMPAPVAPDSTYRFAGWYDRTTRNLVTEPTWTVAGAGASFEAIWKQLKVEAVNALYYGTDRLPVKTQIAVGFSLANYGSVTLEGLKATLATTSSEVTILNDTLSLRNIPAGMHMTNNSRMASPTHAVIEGEANTFRFVISQAVPAGTVIPFTITIVDRSGESWTEEFSFTPR